MIQPNDNPFGTSGLVTPDTQLAYYEQYCQTQQPGRANVKRVPFRRKVDMWFAALSVAVHKNLRPQNLQGQKTSQFITGGEIFTGNDTWRIQVLMLIAIAIEDTVEVVTDPRRMMEIANGLAAAGVPHIVRMLQEGGEDPIVNISDALEDLLRSKEEDSRRERLDAVDE